MMNKINLMVFTFVMMWLIKPAAADQLIFVHSPTCLYCEAWRADIMPLYHKTDEGKRLPLREVNLDEGLPKDLKHLLYPSFTPTFIVVDDKNQEIGRILGYDKEFFWGFLQSYIQKLDGKQESQS